MPAIPLLSGIAANNLAEFTQTIPVNLEPLAIDSNISKGQLRCAAGARQMGTGPGIDRGAIVFNGVHYRVMGTKLVSVATDGTPTILGDVGAGGPVGLSYGFDRLAIQSGTNLFYWNGTTLVQVTDTDLGLCLDVQFMNGQFFSIDGTDVVATDIGDPTNVNPLRYGSAEADPDPITGLIQLRNEMYVCGTNTIEVQIYTGGSNFPLTVQEGSTILKGVCGPRAKVRYSQTFAFVGSGRNEQLGVYLADGATALKLSTRYIDDLLAAVTDPTMIEMEARVYRDEERLLVHLPDRTLVYLFAASTLASTQVWYEARSGVGADKAYRPRHAVLFNGQAWVGDTETGAIGVLDEGIASHFGEMVGWSFTTTVLWNKTLSAILHQIEMVGLFGRGVVAAASVLMSMSLDGQTWSLERANKLPGNGSRNKRIVWSPNKRFRNMLFLRFRGDSNSLIGIATLYVPDADGYEALSA